MIGLLSTYHITALALCQCYCFFLVVRFLAGCFAVAFFLTGGSTTSAVEVTTVIVASAPTAFSSSLRSNCLGSSERVTSSFVEGVDVPTDDSDPVEGIDEVPAGLSKTKGLTSGVGWGVSTLGTPNKELLKRFSQFIFTLPSKHG